jgi:hypothetical protein
MMEREAGKVTCEKETIYRLKDGNKRLRKYKIIYIYCCC